MEKQVTYITNEIKTKEGLVLAVKQYLEVCENMETQLLQDPSGISTCLQARSRHGKLKQFIGMDRALTIRFIKSENTVTVEIGEAKWCDKAIAMTTSFFWMWPLAITSGIGIYKQKRLPGKIINAMEHYLHCEL